MLSIPIGDSAVEEFAVDVEVDGSEILEISIRIFIGSKTQIPNVLLSKEAFTVSWRIGNLGLVLGPTQWRSVCLLFKILFATTQKYIFFKSGSITQLTLSNAREERSVHPLLRIGGRC